MIILSLISDDSDFCHFSIFFELRPFMTYMKVYIGCSYLSCLNVSFFEMIYF